MGLCPTPLFLFEKKFQGGHTDVTINHYFCERCITNGYRIPGMGVTAHVGVRVWNKK